MLVDQRTSDETKHHGPTVVRSNYPSVAYRNRSRRCLLGDRGDSVIPNKLLEYYES
jgi:hypothetical protein